MDAIESALAAFTDDVAFELLCCRVLNSEGWDVEPRGGTGDAGRDAIEGADVTFQYSLEKPAKKLDFELARLRRQKKRPKEYVYCTNRRISSQTKDKYLRQFARLKVKLHTFDGAWLSAKIGAADLKHVRDELLAASLVSAPDMVRHALGSPIRGPMLATLAEGAKAALTDERLGRVRALRAAEAFKAAETLLGEILAQGGLPTDQQFAAHTEMANLCAQLERIDEAKAHWIKAIATGYPDCVPAANFATVLIFYENDDSAAGEIVDKALEVSPRCAGLINLKGLLEWRAGNTGRAIELYKRAFEIEPEPEYLLNVWSLQSEEPSDQDIERALQQHPKHKGLLLRHANRLLEGFQSKRDPMLLQKTGETISQALSDFLPRIERERDRLRFSRLDWEWIGAALNTMASVAYWNRDHARAEQLVRLAMIFDDAPLLHSTLGQVRFARGQYGEAIESYEAAIRGGYDKGGTWLQLGNAHAVRLGQTRLQVDFMKAAYSYDQASATQPVALINLAQLHWEYGSKELARELAEKALAASPNEPVALCNSIVYACDGDSAKIVDSMIKVEIEHPNHPTVLTVLGDHHYRLEHWREAYTYLARAAKAGVNNSLVLQHAYLQGADALAKSIGGSEGRVKAIEFLREGVGRLPGSVLLAETLRDLSNGRD